MAAQYRLVVGDDEPVLRSHLRRHLALLWPQLEIVGEARNGPEALDLFDALQPQILFLDVQMPGMNGIEVARQIQRRAQVVFITAFDRYAVQAFERGAIDYLVKPIDDLRLRDTVERLQTRLAQPFGPAEHWHAALDQLAHQVSKHAAPRAWLRWVKATVGTRTRLIPVADIIYLQAEEKYTRVVWPGGAELVRKNLSEFIEQLDPECFVQTHRSTIVNLHFVEQVVRGMNETAEVHLRGRAEVLPVSRSYLFHFRAS